MNRLQKKCLIATAGFHLLLVLILVFGSAFFNSHSKPDETQLLDVIPANLIDAAFNSGVKNAQAPAPTPPQPPQPVQPPQPPQPQPKPEPVKPPDPEPVKPAPTLMKKVEDFFKPEPKKLSPEALEPVEKPAKPTPKKREISLTPVVHNVPKVTPDTSEADARAAAKEAKEQKRLHDQQARAFRSALASIKENSSTATEINMPGNSSVAYANYGAAVVSVYHHAWTSPDNMITAVAVVRFSVTIARDGNVISSRIVTSSGDASVDKAVQRMLDRVSFIGEFPDDSKDKQRTYNIDFNATRTSIL
jgi:TonB family protein